MNSWFNEKGFLGVRKGIWLLDLFVACACGLIIWVLHVKPIVDSMVAVGRAHDIAFDIMAESHSYFATSNGVHVEDLKVPFNCTYLCDDDTERNFKRALTTAKIQLPTLFEDGSRGHMMQAANYVLTGEAKAALVDLNVASKKSQKLLHDRLEEKKSELFTL